MRSRSGLKPRSQAEVAVAKGYGVLAYNVQGDPRREEAGVRTLIQRRVDAIVFTTPLLADNVRLAVEGGIPVVQVERPTAVETASVRVDNYAGTVAAMEHLLALGHRSIGFIGAQFAAGTTGEGTIEQQRYRAYRDCLDRAQVPYVEAWVGLGDYYSLEAGVDANDGYRFACRFLDGSPRRQPSWPPATCSPPVCYRPLTSAGFGCRATYRLSVSTTPWRPT